MWAPLTGVACLDKEVEIIDGDVVKGKTTLREILLNQVRTKGGRSVFAEIHQRGTENPMVIVPNEAEVESFLLRLNHQLPAFLLHYLTTIVGLPVPFVETLLKKPVNQVSSMKPSNANGIKTPG